MEHASSDAPATGEGYSLSLDSIPFDDSFQFWAIYVGIWQPFLMISRPSPQALVRGKVPATRVLARYYRLALGKLDYPVQ